MSMQQLVDRYLEAKSQDDLAEAAYEMAEKARQKTGHESREAAYALGNALGLDRQTGDRFLALDATHNLHVKSRRHCSGGSLTISAEVIEVQTLAPEPVQAAAPRLNAGTTEFYQ